MELDLWLVEEGRSVGYELEGTRRCVRAVARGSDSGLVKLAGDGEREK